MREGTGSINATFDATIIFQVCGSVLQIGYWLLWRLNCSSSQALDGWPGSQLIRSRSIERLADLLQPSGLPDSDSVVDHALWGTLYRIGTHDPSEHFSVPWFMVLSGHTYLHTTQMPL